MGRDRWRDRDGVDMSEWRDRDGTGMIVRSEWRGHDVVKWIIDWRCLILTRQKWSKKASFWMCGGVSGTDEFDQAKWSKMAWGRKRIVGAGPKVNCRCGAEKELWARGRK